MLPLTIVVSFLPSLCHYPIFPLSLSSEYYYIGGYYGQSTPLLMQEEILANGPISVSFEVYPDLQAYAGGVYTHQFTKELKSAYNPFELTNHVVVIIGQRASAFASPAVLLSLCLEMHDAST
jgi:hypothetical protein